MRVGPLRVLWVQNFKALGFTIAGLGDFLLRRIRDGADRCFRDM